MKIGYTNQAKTDLQKIARFTIDEWGTNKAQQYVSNLNKKINLLSEFPQMGITRNELSSNLFSVLHEQHIIFYKILSDTVMVLRIIHTRKDVDLDVMRSYYI